MYPQAKWAVHISS